MKSSYYKFIFCFAIILLVITAEQAFAQDKQKPPQPEPKTQTGSAEFKAELERAKQALNEGQIDEAMKLLNKAADMNKGNCLECYQIIGQVAFQLGDYAQAATALRKALALKPENEIGLTNMLGVALYLQDDKNALQESITTFRRVIETAGDKYPKAYYNLGFALIKAGKEKDGVEALKKYVAIEPNSSQAGQAKTVIANPKLAGESLAIDFKVKTYAGEELSLSNLKGKVVLLDFWATWCGPCIVEMPAVKATWQKYQNDNFVIVGVSLDRNKKAFETYIKKEGISWVQYFDGAGWDNKIARLYNVHSIPQTVLIDHQGVIRAVGLRGQQLYKKIGDLINRVREDKNAATK